MTDRPNGQASDYARPVPADLGVDTIVATAPAALSAPLSPDSRRVARLCLNPRSVAEIAATLDIPLTDTWKLVDDLDAAGHVMCTIRQEIDDEALHRILRHIKHL
ncbi:hypothetical protein Val02_64140 [Virgisporangium aliadipatigenens]|uniref:Uncharacterized protein n=1 Tax=Virgisporangium aliadipatigenens TaxID=741659 RepID=A0A8J4DTZ0_9ACTN|nr:DUF742 domain-containing protein [Virgisporangium aliadipatigenens]GIJ49528.1 hypothetical protein Val02_64140 [Virgisporangium aliadipatigenens]